MTERPQMISNEPLSEQYRVAALRWADLDNAARMLEEGKTTFLAQRKAALGDIPDSHAEKQVKASPEWADYIKSMVRSKTQANVAKVELEYIRMKFAEWNSAEANQRIERKL